METRFKNFKFFMGMNISRLSFSVFLLKFYFYLICFNIGYPMVVLVFKVSKKYTMYIAQMLF